MSCIGTYKRNVITLNDTFWWFLFWMLFTLLGYVSADIGVHVFSAKGLFWTWNITETIGYECFHLIIPLFLNIPSQGSCTKRQFYVRKYVPEPNRPRIKTITSLVLNDRKSRVIQVAEQTNGESVPNQGEDSSQIFCYPRYKKLYESWEDEA